MTRFGYTLMAEQSGPKELVRYAISAEQPRREVAFARWGRSVSLADWAAGALA
ncbi:hypothetical protein [Candidatus Mycolicibacterium alkanivorans]|uniref:Uncharacterized protein n=1 Tax=Candidatus Mycolicibacterium alkanivorans TaxID=2954114 RepID=A0ABS9YTC3_9MYCO|nr:hypothetical protein [Candidatus Mycolicibacterium alkanivorans]MCI4674378.1 hypothetical protein [Candidatus Mycolicibacterium alkanivorans]